MIEFIPRLFEVRVTNAARIRRARELPIPGEVSGAVGLRVGAQDVIGRIYPPKYRRALSLTRVIGVREADVPKRLLKQVGDPVEAREIIIAKPINFGIQRLVYRAPEAGQIAAIQGSWMILDIYDAPQDVLALYRGTIVGVTPRHGAMIEAYGALIQGVWGTGAEAVGVIKWFSKSPDSVLDADVLEADTRGTILIAGGGVTAALLQRANEFRAAGIVTGSLAPELRSLAGSIDVPILVTEGFGQIPMSQPTFDLLIALNGQEAGINARYQPRGRHSTRPELFVPLVLSRMQQSEQESEEKNPEVKPHALVRGAYGAYLGRIGKLPADFPLEWISTDAGTQIPGVTVEWNDTPGEHERVPWTNLELIG